jgi:hypothetical protein
LPLVMFGIVGRVAHVIKEVLHVDDQECRLHL